MTKDKRKFNLRRFWSDHPVICNLLLMVAVVFVLVFAADMFLKSWTMHGSTSVVPEVRGMRYDRAATVLEANNLSIEISDSIYDGSRAPGTVIESWPKPGAVVKEGRQVYVTITAFSPKNVTVSMPLTGNVSSRQAISYLRGIGIRDIRLEQVPSEFPDLVMGARYGTTPLTVGTVLPVTATVTLEVGSGPVSEPDSIAELELADEGALELTSIEE